MRIYRAVFFVLFSITSFFALSFIFLGPARAQQATPQFLFTWSASNSYVPPSYKGKVLPEQQSKITASFELVSGGKIVNIENQPVYWYLDDTLIGGGAGMQQITFSPFGMAPEMETLKAELPNYPGGYLIHQATIPVINPAAVIEAPYPNGQFSGTSATVTALPYFFSVPANDLSFTWSVNGQSGSNAENPDVLDINLPTGTPSGSTLAVSLQAQNTNDGQSASVSTNLVYQQQL